MLFRERMHFIARKTTCAFELHTYPLGFELLRSKEALPLLGSSYSEPLTFQDTLKHNNKEMIRFTNCRFNTCKCKSNKKMIRKIILHHQFETSNRCCHPTNAENRCFPCSIQLQPKNTNFLRQTY